MFVFAVIYGLIRGGVLPLVFLVWTEFYGRRSSGTVLGLGSPFRLAANAAGPVFGALFFDLFHHYWIPFTIFSILLILAGVLSFTAAPPSPPETQPEKHESS